VARSRQNLGNPSTSLDQAPTHPVFVFFIVIIMMRLMIMFGNYMYWRDVGSSQFDTEVTLGSDKEAAELPHSAHVLRAVDEGLFLVWKETPGQVVFVKKDAVKMLAQNVRK
jgi:hypothetical protein